MMSRARYVRLPLFRPQTPTIDLKIPWGLTIEVINRAITKKADINASDFFGPCS